MNWCTVHDLILCVGGSLFAAVSRHFKQELFAAIFYLPLRDCLKINDWFDGSIIRKYLIVCTASSTVRCAVVGKETYTNSAVVPCYDTWRRSGSEVGCCDAVSLKKAPTFSKKSNEKKLLLQENGS